MNGETTPLITNKNGKPKPLGCLLLVLLAFIPSLCWMYWGGTFSGGKSVSNILYTDEIYPTEQQFQQYVDNSVVIEYNVNDLPDSINSIFGLESDEYIMFHSALVTANGYDSTNYKNIHFQVTYNTNDEDVVKCKTKYAHSAYNHADFMAINCETDYELTGCLSTSADIDGVDCYMSQEDNETFTLLSARCCLTNEEYCLTGQTHSKKKNHDSGLGATNNPVQVDCYTDEDKLGYLKLQPYCGQLTGNKHKAKCKAIVTDTNINQTGRANSNCTSKGYTLTYCQEDNSILITKEEDVSGGNSMGRMFGVWCIYVHISMLCF